MTSMLGIVLSILLHVNISDVEVTSPEAVLSQGQEVFQRGDFAQAIDTWAQAGQGFEQAQKPTEHSRDLVQLAQAYQALGHYQEAITHLQTAYALVQQSGNQSELAIVLDSGLLSEA